jgi:hypothetical protein
VVLGQPHVAKAELVRRLGDLDAASEDDLRGLSRRALEKEKRPEFHPRSLLAVARLAPWRGVAYSTVSARLPRLPMRRMPPALPMHRMLPALPILKMLPALPMLRMLPELPMLSTDPTLATLPMLRNDAALPRLSRLSALPIDQPLR